MGGLIPVAWPCCLDPVDEQKSFSNFITMHPQFRNWDGSMLPASQNVVLEWVAWLSSIKRLKPKTIKSYVTHLRSAHINAGLSFSACESPMLQCFIRGIKRYMGECEQVPKMPITHDMLMHIQASTTHSNL